MFQTNKNRCLIFFICCSVLLALKQLKHTLDRHACAIDWERAWWNVCECVIKLKYIAQKCVCAYAMRGECMHFVFYLKSCSCVWCSMFTAPPVIACENTHGKRHGIENLIDFGTDTHTHIERYTLSPKQWRCLSSCLTNDAILPLCLSISLLLIHSQNAFSFINALL